jgi:hypothetical protein
MTEQGKRPKDTLPRINLGALVDYGICIIICLWIIIYSGCIKESPLPEESTKLSHRQIKVDSISCHWSTRQVEEGACWCVEDSWRQGGIALVPNKFCGRD